jgi:hypothetical protein
MNDPLDLAAMGAAIKDAKPVKRTKWRRLWVRVPWSWVGGLTRARRVSTPLLALLLCYEHWRNGGRQIVLSNVIAKEVRLSPRSKTRALAELENLGLVKVERRRRRAPRVTLKLDRSA